MPDPRFNSVHLPAPRRQEYRRARQDVFEACGNRTLLLPEHSEADASHTIVVDQDDETLQGCDFWLKDQDYLYPLKSGLNTLGRAADNDVVVADECISRRHCVIVVHLHNGSCEVHDTASKNGTFLNGSKLATPTPLRSGDEIRVCDRRFVFVSRSAVGQNTLTVS